MADPWYTNNFDTVWRDIRESCLGLMNALVYPLRKAVLSDTREVMALYRSAIGRPDVMWDEGVHSIRLLAAVDNLPALATYRHLGFANRGKVTMFGHVYFAEEKAL